ncbi:hypothetical protein IAT40_006209 [Kwoniella sp. CBS 6097]
MLHDTNNVALEHEFNHLALNLRNMWYQHGYTGLRYFRQHMADIYNRFQHLLDEDKMDHETARAAMGACDDLMALKTVPSESWAPYVAGIKRRLSESEGEGEGESEASPMISTTSSPEDSPLEEHPTTAAAAASGLMSSQAQASQPGSPSDTTKSHGGMSSQARTKSLSRTSTPRRAS